MKKGLAIGLGILAGLGIVAAGVGVTYALNDQVHDYIDNNIVNDSGDDLSGIKIVNTLVLGEAEQAAQGIQSEEGAEPVYKLNLELQGLDGTIDTDGYLVTKITFGDKTEAKLSHYNGTIWAYDSITHLTNEEIWLTHETFANPGDSATYTLMTYWADHPSVYLNTTIKFKYEEKKASSSEQPTTSEDGSGSSSESSSSDSSASA